MVQSIEQEKTFRRSREREPARETREAKETRADEEVKRAAALERAEFLAREVKTSKKQMQNILLNIQQVTQAIAQLRAQLQMAVTTGDPLSVAHDKKRIEDLKKKIAEHQGELESMRTDLVRAEMEELQKGIGVGLSMAELQQKAEEAVGRMMEEMKK